ncbi:MAG: glycosyltransferase family 9 protein [Candidatus Competibacteraceae bacterium]
MIERVRILVLRGGAIGDFMLTLPALCALRRQWPDAYLEIIGYPHIAELARAAGLADHIDSLDRARIAMLFSDRPGPDPALRAHIRSFHFVLSYLHDPNGVVVENLRRSGSKQVLYGSPKPSAAGLHAADHLLRPLEELALFEAGAVPRLDLLPRHRDAGHARLAQLGLRGGRPPVALHPGSGSPSKNWPVERFINLALALAKRGVAPFFLTGEADLPALESIRRAAPKDIPLVRGLSLLETAELLSACPFFAGNDSGITHLAAALQCRCWAIFGPSDPSVWGPRGAHVSILRAPDGILEALSLHAVLEAMSGGLAADR